MAELWKSEERYKWFFMGLLLMAKEECLFRLRENCASCLFGEKRFYWKCGRCLLWEEFIGNFLRQVLLLGRAIFEWFVSDDWKIDFINIREQVCAKWLVRIYKERLVSGGGEKEIHTNRVGDRWRKMCQVIVGNKTKHWFIENCVNK